MLTVGSLFSGIGGFDLGLERAGMRVAWQCESDEFCRSVLATHWPLTSCYWDVRKVSGYELPHHTDVLCGGFPCQDLSIAGRGEGITGTRSGLWAEFARLIGEIRPRYVIVENVAALLARGLGRVIGDLAALGYDAEWDCVPASAVGAPHERDRLWIVAYPNREGSEFHESRGCRSGRQLPGASQSAVVQRRDGPRGPEGCWAGGDFAAANPEIRWSRPRRGFESSGQSEGHGHRVDLAPPPEPLLSGMDDGLSAWLDSHRPDAVAALGNALVPQIAEWIGRRILDYEAGELAA